MGIVPSGIGNIGHDNLPNFMELNSLMVPILSKRGQLTFAIEGLPTVYTVKSIKEQDESYGNNATCKIILTSLNPAINEEQRKSLHKQGIHYVDHAGMQESFVSVHDSYVADNIVEATGLDPALYKYIIQDMDKEQK